MGGKIGAIIIVIVLLGVGLYLVTSGVLTKGLHGFDSLVGPSSTFSLFPSSGSSSVTGPSAPLGPPPPQQTAPTSSEPTSTIAPGDIPAGFTAAQLSPYFHEVLLASISPGTSYYYGTITLSTYFNATGTIDITGWQIKSRNSGEYIPQAVDIYDPSGLAPESDIRVKSGDTVYLYSSSAPFNVRLNECIGYVAHVANFNPPLPLDCPYVSSSQIEGFSGVCQNYINTIGACQQPNLSSPQVPQNDYACQNYLQNNFTYKSCFAEHESDPNFLSNQVWVWTGSNVVDQYHDNVELLDRNGLLVALYTY